MRQLLVCLLLLAICGQVQPSPVHAAHRNDSEVAAAVQQTMEEVLDLWREGRFAELYDRTVPSGKETRESFARRLGEAPLKPACCWEKLQEVRVTVKGATRAVLRGRVGLDGPGDTEFKTRSFTLQREGEVWLVSRTDLLALADAGPKKKRQTTRRYHR
jgi:hypothetical protein